MYTSLKSSQSRRALCLVLLERSILNLLHKLSKEFEDAGNLDRAKASESSTLFKSKILNYDILDSKNGKTILSKGKRLVLFPEGTSSDGNRVLKFKSSLFSVVEKEPNVKDTYSIQAVTICYKGINGLPMSRSERPYLSWWGDMGLIGHLWKMLSFRSADIIVIAHQPIVDEINRKILSDIAWKQVAYGLGLAMSGRARPLKQNDTAFEVL